MSPPPRALLALCVLALLPVLGAAAAAECAFDGLDFSSLMGTDIKGSDGGAVYDYYMSLCGVLSSPDAGRCLLLASTSSLCQKRRGNYDSFDLGNWPAAWESPPAWSYIDAAKSGVQYTLTGSPDCWVGGSPIFYSSTVVLKCADEQGPLTVTTAGTCGNTFTLPTPLACQSGGGAASNGTGGGGAGGGGSGSGTGVTVKRQLFANNTQGVCSDLQSTAVSYDGGACYLMETGRYATFTCDPLQGDVYKFNYGASASCSGPPLSNVSLSTACMDNGNGVGASKWTCEVSSASSIAVSSLLLAALAAVAAFIQA